VRLNAAGQVALKLETPCRDGTTHLVLRRGADSPVDCLRQPRGRSSAGARPAMLGPLEFMQRLAAQTTIPRARLNRIGFRGLLAPNAELRAQVESPGPPAHEESASGAADAAGRGVDCPPLAEAHRLRAAARARVGHDA
jgi:hypothetical protein